MNTNSRTRNSVINLFVNIGYQVFIIFITFFIRRIFIETLGVEYLGISGLFDSIFSVLALAELGISSAITYSMYQYIANDDKEKLTALTNYYKKLYNRIALIVGVVGIALLPFLKYIINLDENIPHIELYYILNLINTVSSYLFVYKTTIVNADQRGYRLKLITSVVEVLKLITQLIALYVFKSYLIYLLIWIVFIISENIIKSRLAVKWYPFVNDKAELEEKEKKTIWDNIKSMFMYKIGGVVMNHTDNILISVLVSTTMVGLYSNYNMIFRKLDGYSYLVFNSLTASVGNLNVMATKEKKYFIFRVFMLIAFLFFAISAIGIYFVGEDVIMAVVQKSSYILPREIMIIGITYFFVSGMCYPCTSFRTTTGLFKIAKYSMLMASIFNIILSIIFGKIFGLFGIILASLVSKLLTNIWYEPYLLYKNFFEENVSKYYLTQITRLVLVVIIILAMTPIMNLIQMDHLYLRILVKSIICVIIPGIILYIIFHNSEEFKYLLNKIIEVSKKIKKKVLKNQ